MAYTESYTRRARGRNARSRTSVWRRSCLCLSCRHCFKMQALAEELRRLPWRARRD